MISKESMRKAIETAGLSTYNIDMIMQSRRMDDNKRKAALYKALRDMGYSYNKIGLVMDRCHSTIYQVITAHYGDK